VQAINSLEGELEPEILGHAGRIYEHVLGEARYTFLEDVANPSSVTILIKGPNKHTLLQIKDAIRDGLRAVKNAIEDDCVIPGAGAFELAVHEHLKSKIKDIKGRARLGVEAFADAMLIIPKVLALNAGFDAQESIVKLQETAQETGEVVGIDLNTGEACIPADEGIFDNYNVKRNMIHSACVIASQLLLVDEVMRAGMSSLKG
jgi:T-complex protein 1 subunit zeta